MHTVSKKQLSLTLLFAGLVLIIIAATSLIFDIRVPLMTRDIASIGDVHPLAGILSSLGILLWCAVAAICFFSAMILRQSSLKPAVLFLCSSGALTLYLMLDDLFQFHEFLAPQYLGLSEKMVYVLMATAVFYYLLKFRTIILSTNYFILVCAFGLLGFSVVIDSILEPWLWRLGHWEYFFEDGAKWLGIVAWGSYFINTSHQFITAGAQQSNNAMQAES